MQCSTKTCAQLRCFENGNDDFGVEAFWIGDAARVGYFVPLNGPLNGHPPSYYYYHQYCVTSTESIIKTELMGKSIKQCISQTTLHKKIVKKDRFYPSTHHKCHVSRSLLTVLKMFFAKLEFWKEQKNIKTF